MDFLLVLFLRKNYCQSLAKMCMLLRTLAHKVKTLFWFGFNENSGLIVKTFRNKINTITVPVESLVMFTISFVGDGTQISVLRPYQGSTTIIEQIGEM